MPNTIPIERLQKIAGKDNLRTQSNKTLISVENAGVVCEIVKLANQERFKVLPLGFGSLLDWTRLPSENLVILTSDRINQIKKVVPEDLYVILQAGFPLKNLNRELEPFNLFYPLADSSSQATIGGSVATNLKGKSGDKSVQTTEYVLALELINPEGQIINVGARTFKSVTGYDLPRLFVGSWGTLGFMSEISLRLIPYRKRKDYPRLVFDSAILRTNDGPSDPKAVLGSRIKKALDPNEVFFSLNSLS
ncbi:MAG: FAD-binding oxidoreductase [Candidatus Zixiibacteriota bacterium]